jgi:hypothetical protein
MYVIVVLLYKDNVSNQSVLWYRRRNKKIISPSLSWFLASFLTVFKSFIPFRNLFTSNTNLSNAFKQSRKCKRLQNHVAERHHLLAGLCPPPLPLLLLRETFRSYVPIWTLTSGRRPEKVHCTELLHTLYVFSWLNQSGRGV